MPVTRWLAGALALTMFACVPASDPDVSDAGDADAGDQTDAGLAAGDTLFNAHPEISSVWPGGLLGVDLFFQPQPVGAWALSVHDVEGGTVTLERTVLDEAHPRVRVLVEVDRGAKGSVRFVARATQGSDVRESAVQVWLNSDDEVAPGFEIYTAAEAAEVPAGVAAGFLVRVISYGGFTGAVSLVAGDGVEGLQSVAFDDAQVEVAAGGFGQTRMQVRAAPNVESINAPVWGAHGRKVKVATSSSHSRVVAPAEPVYGLWLPRRLYVSRGQSLFFVRKLVMSGRFGPLDATFELVSPPAGISLQPGGLVVSASATPGVYDLDVVARAEGGIEAHGALRLVVPGDVEGWALVGGVMPPPGVTADGLFANGRGPLEVPGPGGHLRFFDGAWTWLAGDASRFSTCSRGSVRVEGRQRPDGLVSVSEVDTDPSGFGTRFWQPGDTGSRVRAPSVAVDGLGETWAAFESQRFTTAIFRRGTVAGGVPVVDGLPAVATSRPLIAAGGTSVVVALAGTERVALASFDRPTGRWVELPALDVQLADDDVRLLALDVDVEGRAVLAWVGVDEVVHLVRLQEGAWEEVRTFMTSEKTIALSLDLRVGADGRMTVAWLEAAHVLTPGAWPSPASPTKLRFVTGGDTWTETSLTAFDPTAAVGAPVFDLDDAGSLVVAFPEEDALAVVRQE